MLRVIAKAVNLALVAVLIKSIPRGSCPSGLVHLLLSNDLSVVKTMATVNITRGDGLVLILVPVIGWGLRPPPLRASLGVLDSREELGLDTCPPKRVVVEG